MNSDIAFEALGKPCRLRSWRPDDARTLQAIADEEDVARFMRLSFPSPYTLNDARAYIADASLPSSMRLAIEAENTLAGGINLQIMDDVHRGVGRCGYWLGRAFWYRGIAQGATRALVHMAFVHLNLRRIESHVMAGNDASSRVLEKTGFTMEGRLRDSYIDRYGIVRDALVYGLLSKEFSRTIA